MQKQPFEKHVWAEIDLEALRYNFREVKARAGELPLCAVVKADSYGHGAVQCARVFAEEGAAWLAVSCLTEAVQLRKAGQTLPILILGHVQPAYAAALIQNDITVACYSLAQARALSEAAVGAAECTSTSRPTPVWGASALPCAPILTPPSGRCWKPVRCPGWK